MRLFDEDMNEVFLYAYTDGNEEGLSHFIIFKSSVELSNEDLNNAYDEYALLKEYRYEEIENLQKEYSHVFDPVPRNAPRKEREQMEEDRQKDYLEYREKLDAIENLPDIYVFLAKKFNLLEMNFPSI